MEENKPFGPLSGWLKASLIAFAIAVSTPTGCMIYEDYQTASLIQKGSEPMAAFCAIHGAGNGNLICLLARMKP